MTYRIAKRDTQPIKDFWHEQEPFLQELTEAERQWWAVELRYSPPRHSGDGQPGA